MKIAYLATFFCPLFLAHTVLGGQCQVAAHADNSVCGSPEDMAALTALADCHYNQCQDDRRLLRNTLQRKPEEKGPFFRELDECDDCMCNLCPNVGCGACVFICSSQCGGFGTCQCVRREQELSSFEQDVATNNKNNENQDDMAQRQLSSSSDEGGLQNLRVRACMSEWRRTASDGCQAGADLKIKGHGDCDC